MACLAFITVVLRTGQAPALACNNNAHALATLFRPCATSFKHAPVWHQRVNSTPQMHDATTCPTEKCHKADVTTRCRTSGMHACTGGPRVPRQPSQRASMLAKQHTLVPVSSTLRQPGPAQQSWPTILEARPICSSRLAGAASSASATRRLHHDIVPGWPPSRHGLTAERSVRLRPLLPPPWVRSCSFPGPEGRSSREEGLPVGPEDVDGAEEEC